jgi:hypothetical protein
MGFIIGTAILIGLTALVVNPVVHFVFSQRMEAAGMYGETLETLSPGERVYWQGIYDQVYMLWDAIILGVAGFLAGYLFGFVLIGISFSKRGWPGMLAFIVLSVVGSAIRGAHGGGTPG